MKKSTRRFEVQMSESTAKEFEELVEDLGAESKAEVFRRALQTFKSLLDVQKDGGEVLIRKQNGEEMKLILLWTINKEDNS
jgi:metal-responsive CopG/Arc/MetJ family transcriptional regulator